ncbi:MAG: hypothetical protein WC378_10985 [Opitutaceae bacterium]|jgi:hypothetical protein
MKHPIRAGWKAFTLVETLLCCLLIALLLGALLSGLLFLQRTLMPPRMLVGGAILPVAPSYVPFPAAVKLQERLIAHLDGSIATYVFGGGHSGLAEVPPRVVTQPLQATALPSIGSFSSGLPQDSANFQRLYAAELGGMRSDASLSEFSVVTIGAHDGALAVTCLVQCRSSEVRPAGDSRLWRRFEVSLCDIDGSALSYEFLERPGTERSYCAGVMHTWHRLNEAMGVFEEGPACVVFPDPWRFGGDLESSAGEATFSRFTYLLPVGA